MAKWSKAAFLDDVQTCQSDAMDAIRAAYKLVHYQAVTEMDTRALGELDYAMKRIRRAWELVVQEHPNGRDKGERC